MADAIVGTVIGRWYVPLFGVAFLVLASRHLGWRRTGIYTAAAILIGVLFSGSVFEASYRVQDGRVMPSIRGKAWVNAQAQLILDERDPFVFGIRP